MRRLAEIVCRREPEALGTKRELKKHLALGREAIDHPLLSLQVAFGQWDH
jgi:hypothetical protein